MNTLKKGDSLPNFECLNDKGNLVKSNDYKGKKIVFILTGNGIYPSIKSGSILTAFLKQLIA